MKIVNNNGKYIASVPMRDSFVSYRNWSPTNAKRNEELQVYIDNISYLTRMFRPLYCNRTDVPLNFFTPSTTIEFLSRDKVSYTNIVQITDTYTYKDNIIFELDNQIVKLYDESGDLVSSYKSISKIIHEGSFTQVRMDIDGGYCGSFLVFNGYPDESPSSCNPPNCSLGQSCYYNGWDCCCTNSNVNCTDGCNQNCNAQPGMEIC
jgi:hypothetical protein